VCPGEEFLPTPPDPNDIVYEPTDEGQDNQPIEPGTGQESGEPSTPVVDEAATTEHDNSGTTQSTGVDTPVTQDDRSTEANGTENDS